MTDLHTRFRTLDDLSAPNLWSDIEQRAMAIQPVRRSSTWVLIAVILLLALAVGGAVLVGSGVIKLPTIVDPSASPSSANPSSSAQASTTASASPVAPVPASWTAIEAATGQTATALLDGRVLLAGGGNDLASAELYDPSTGSWTATGKMSEARSTYTATLLPNGKVLVAGGNSGAVGDGPTPGLASAELYDPGTGTWSPTGSMGEPRCSPTATLLGTGKVLVAGGNNCVGYDALATAELYDPGSGTWSPAADMVEVRSGHTATLLLTGIVLVAGSGRDPASAELYDPSSDTWTATGAMVEGRIYHTATRLLDGRVLVAGSMNGTGSSASAELFDPSTGQWTATGAMQGGRIYHTATLLPSGKVLVVGGTDSVIDGGQASASAELYDPDTRAWTATAAMIEAGGHTATLLADGTVLVTGGIDVAFAELYDPGSGG